MFVTESIVYTTASKTGCQQMAVPPQKPAAAPDRGSSTGLRPC